MKVVWTKHIKDQEEKDKFEHGLRNWLTHDPYVKRLKELLEQERQSVYKAAVFKKEDPERKLGCLLAFETINSILSLTKEEEKTNE